MDQATELAERIGSAVEITEPWPHTIIDEFLPEDIYRELLEILPPWTAQKTTKDLTQALEALLRSDELESAIRKRWGFQEHHATIELTFRTTGLLPHQDRKDKAWSGIVYLAGDPNTGTDLYDAQRNLVKRVEFSPNRLLCWGRRGEQHSVPPGNGRWAIQWWFLKSKGK